MQCQCCDVVQCHIATGRDEGQHNGTWDRQLALLVIPIPVSPPSWCLFNIYSLSIRLYHTDKAIHMYTYIFSLRMYACVNLKLSASAICFSNQSSFKQFPITYEYLHLYILFYPIMTTKIHFWRLNWPFSRTVHLLQEGGGQEEDTNCASKNYEREKDFAPFKRFLIKEVSHPQHLRIWEKAYYMKSAWQIWYLRFPLEFPKRTKIIRVHNTELCSNSSSDSTIPNYKSREKKERISIPQEYKRDNRKCQDRLDEKLPSLLCYDLIWTI